MYLLGGWQSYVVEVDVDVEGVVHWVVLVSISTTFSEGCSFVTIICM